MIFCDPPARYILETMRPTSAAPQMPIWTGTTAFQPMTKEMESKPNMRSALLEEVTYSRALR